MTVNYTTLLQLPQPVDGTEAGTWGDVLNNAQAAYLDIAIAGGLAVSITSADVTLTATQGTSSATNIGSTTSQYAILNVSGAMTGARNLIVPSTSKWYIINNTCTGGFTLTVKGSATTGITLINGEKALVAWNGSDFVKIANISGSGTFSSITNTGLTSGRVVYSTTGGLETDSANLLYSGTDLTVYGLTVGRGAGAISTNTAVGASALAANTTGASNTAIGQQALTANTTASNNTAVGYQAGYSNTTGTSNAYLGFKSGYYDVGSNNSYFGYASGPGVASSSATNNTGIGYAALINATTGSNNTAIGASSQFSTTTGANNTSQGYQALYSNTTSSNSTAIGYQAGTVATGAGNQLFGYSAGSAITTGANNVIIGAYTGSAAPISATGSNYIVLSDGAGNVRQLWNSSGALGIGGATYGTAGQVLTSGGSGAAPTWATGSGYGGHRAQFFNTPGSSQTFLIPTGVTSVKVTLQAGGGGGGGPNNCNTSNGGAGGAGGAGVQWFTGLTPGNTLTVTVGAAGTAGGTAGNGGTGGSSSVASGTQTISTISATGGTGGQWSGGGGGTGSAGTASGFVNGTAITGVAITGTAGQFSCSASSLTLATGQRLTISGTLGGTGTITGYTNPTSYYIIATNGSTTFTLSATYGGAAITTTAGTPTGLTYAIIDSGAAGFTLVAGTYWNPLNKGAPGTGAVPSGGGAGAGGAGAVLFEY